MSPMSKDRVHFKLIYPAGGYWTGTDAQAQLTACRRAFRLDDSIAKAAAKQGIEIICRPSQFARFLIYRGEAGGQNLIKALQPRLVAPPPPVPQPVDVSKNPA